LRIALIVEIAILLTNVIAINRDYQDIWILEGLEIPFVILMITYVIYAFVEKNIGWTVFFALIFRSVLGVLPNLKYVWFQGVWIDQARHFKLFQDIYNTGYVPGGRQYSGTPLMHLLFAVYQEATGASALFTFKYVPLICWLIYPLAVYVTTKQAMPKNSSIQKFAVLISSIPVKATTSYVVVGAVFGTLIAFLFLTQFIKVFRINAHPLASNRSHWLIALIYSFALVITHSYSSLILAIGILIIYLMLNLRMRRFKLPRFHAVSSNLVMFLCVLSISWLVFNSARLFTAMTQIIDVFLRAFFGIAPTDLPTTGIRPAYFKLDFMDAIRVLLVYNGGDIIVALLTLIGLVIVIKKFRRSKPLIFLSLYYVSVWLFYAVQLLLPAARAGLVEYNRIFEHTIVLAPIFIGILLYHLQKKSRFLPLLIIIALAGLATIQLYRYQPLIPNSVYGEPRIYIGNVNTAYQRYMIKHAEKYIAGGRISADVVTSSQIFGLTNYDFSQSDSLLFYLVPDDFNFTMVQMESDYLLMHSPGKSGTLSINTPGSLKSLMLEITRGSSILYTNGESYILTKPFMYTFPIPSSNSSAPIS